MIDNFSQKRWNKIARTVLRYEDTIKQRNAIEKQLAKTPTRNITDEQEQKLRDLKVKKDQLGNRISHLENKIRELLK